MLEVASDSRHGGNGSLILIVRGVAAPASSLAEFLVSRANAVVANGVVEAKLRVREATGRARPFRLVVVEESQRLGEIAELAAGLKSVPGSEGMKVLVLADQHSWPEERQLSVDVVLPATVGLMHLVQVIRQLAGVTLPDPDDFHSDDTESIGSILLIEDDIVSQRLTSNMLEELGVDYRIAVDGRSGVAAAQQHEFDVVLMDCMMPGLDGYEATRLLRNLPGQVSLLPVIAMSARASDQDRQRCLAAGMNDYLAKPFDLDQLAEQLRRWLPAVRPNIRLPNQPAHGGAYEDSMADSVPATDADPIHDKALAKLADRLPEDRMARLVRTFIDETPNLLERMENSNKDGDFDEMKLAAHSLKGSSAFLGALLLSGAAKEVETAAEQQQPADNLIRMTASAFHHAREALLDRYPTAANV